MSNQVKDMTWREVQERLREFPVVIVPIGSTEQHGYHLPIGTDVYLAEALAEKTAEKTGALVYPSIHFGYSWSWRDRINCNDPTGYSSGNIERCCSFCRKIRGKNSYFYERT